MSNITMCMLKCARPVYR